MNGNQTIRVWNNHAKVDFKNAIRRIKKDSYENAEKVKIELEKRISQLAIHPERYH